jgi:gamma-glutamylaminecyclotransferase
MKLFVYGTLMQGFWNNRLLEGATPIGRDSIQGAMYSLGGFPYVSLYGEDTRIVHGEVYEIEDDHLRLTDRLEGYPTFYNRSQVVSTNGEPVFVYHIENAPYNGTPVPDGCWREFYGSQSRDD